MGALVIIICLLFSALFSGMETAYISANKVYLEVESRQQSFASKILTRLTENPSHFIAAMLLGNALVQVLYCYTMLLVLPQLFPFYNVVARIFVYAAVSGMLLFTFADFLPKVFFQVYANRLIKIFALPAYVFVVLFGSLSRLMVWFTDFMLVNVFNLRQKDRKNHFTKGEFGAYIKEQLTSVAEEEEVEAEVALFKNAMVFGTRTAADVMTPMEKVSGVAIGSAVNQLRALFVKTGYSKIMVYNGAAENIVGYVHAFSLFKNPETVGEAMTFPIRVGYSMYIKDVLRILTRNRRSVAVIMGDAGQTLGIVTVEDIVEELFGDIEDEHDV